MASLVTTTVAGDLTVTKPNSGGTTAQQVQKWTQTLQNTLLLNMYGGATDLVQLAATNAEQNISIVTEASASLSATTTKGIYIKSGGSVGIGTVSPAVPLHIYANSASGQEIMLENDGAGEVGLILRTDRNSAGNLLGWIGFDGNDSGNVNTRYATIESYIVDSGNSSEDGRLTFSVMAGGNDRESMTIAARSGHSDIGWVGIGTNAPVFPLQVEHPNLINSNAKRILCLRDTTSAAAGTGAGIALGGYTNGTASMINDFGVIQGIKENGSAGNYASAMLFLTRANGGNPTEQMRINSSGCV